MSIRTIREMYRYNAWANEYVLNVASELSDALLDQEYEIGPGLIRETLRHIYFAERIWYTRIGGPGAETLPSPESLNSISEIRTAALALANARCPWLDSLSANDMNRIAEFRDKKGNAWACPVGDILMHAFNHGVHHRAQVASMVSRGGRKLSNLDYLFMRIAKPSIRVADEVTRAKFQAWGRSVGTQLDPSCGFDVAALQHYFEYSDWASGVVLQAAESLNDAALDRHHDIGLASIRRTLLHLQAADQNWLENWTEGSKPGFAELPKETSLADLRTKWERSMAGRNAYVAKQTDETLMREILAQPTEGIKLYFRLGESMLQLCVHATLHRTQIVNMLRHSGIKPPSLDFILWSRQRNAAA